MKPGSEGMGHRVQERKAVGKEGEGQVWGQNGPTAGTAQAWTQTH